MNLQPKRAIAANLATQRKAQIDEGMKLASKVDVLRETVLKEEGNLQRFRTESIASVQADIDRYVIAKDALIQEVAVLERRKADALLPVDAAWVKLRSAEAVLSEKDGRYKQKEISLSERQEQIERAEVEIENEKSRATDIKHRAAAALATATEALEEARKSAADIRNKAHITLLASEAREREVVLKERELEAREAVIETTRMRQAKKDEEQATHDKTIKDKYATLERTINRIAHG